MKWITIIFLFTSCAHSKKQSSTYTPITIYKPIEIYKLDTIRVVEDDTCSSYITSFNWLVKEYTNISALAADFNDSIYYLNTLLSKQIIMPKKVRKSAITVIQGDNNTPTIDQSQTTQKVKDNSAIGNENQLTKTTKKNNWFWIFVAGALSWFVIQNILWRALKTYFPFLNFVK